MAAQPRTNDRATATGRERCSVIPTEMKILSQARRVLNRRRSWSTAAEKRRLLRVKLHSCQVRSRDRSLFRVDYLLLSREINRCKFDFSPHFRNYAYLLKLRKN